MLQQIAIICALLAMVQCIIHARYLDNVRRFGSSTHFDYYYKCRVCNDTLTWHVNSRIVSSYFIQGEVGDIIATPNMSNGHIISILLSSKRNENDQVCLTSMLMVPHLQEPQVACSGNRERIELKNSERSEVCDSYINGSVKMELVFSDGLETGNYKIHVVLCLTYGSMSWQIDGKAFVTFINYINSKSHIGKNNTENQRNDPMLLYRGAILIDRINDSLTSLLVVIENNSTMTSNYMCKSSTDNLDISLPPQISVTEKEQVTTAFHDTTGIPSSNVNTNENTTGTTSSNANINEGTTGMSSSNSNTGKKDYLAFLILFTSENF